MKLPSNLIANVWKNNHDNDLIIQNMQKADLTQTGIYSKILLPGQSKFFYHYDAILPYAKQAFDQSKKLTASLIGMDFTHNSSVIINGLSYFIYTNVAALEAAGLLSSYNPETREIALAQSYNETLLNLLQQIQKTINN